MVFLPKKENCLKMVRGASQTLEIQVLGPDGQPYVLLEEDVIRFGVKHPEGFGAYLIKKERKELVNGITTVDIEPEDTIHMAPGRYCYDIGLQSGTEYFPVVKYSEFVLEPNITWKE